MKRIAFVFPPLLPMPAVKGGATETLVQRLIDDNEIHGKCRFDIFCRYDEEAEQAARKYRNTRFFYIKEQHSLLAKAGELWFRLRRKFSWAYVPEPYLTKVGALMKKECYDAVIVESALRFIPYLKKTSQKPVLLHLHFDAVASKQKNLQQAMEMCDGVMCVSRYIEKTIHSYDRNIKTCVLPNVTDTERFHGQRYVAEVKALKRKLGVKDQDTIILYSGRLIQVKGVMELVKAFKLTAERLPNLTLVLAGSVDYGKTTYDDYYDQLVSEIGELLGKSVFMTGYIDHSEMPVYYSMADIAVLPTTTVDEAAPLSVLEAQACGCFFVGSDSGAIPELACRDYAYVVPRDEQYVANMAQRLEDAAKSYRRDLQPVLTLGRQYVLAYHDAKKYYDNFLQVLQEL